MPNPPNKLNLTKQEVEDALERAGTYDGAAKILGVSRNSIKRYAKKHDLSSGKYGKPLDGNLHWMLARITYRNPGRA